MRKETKEGERQRDKITGKKKMLETKKRQSDKIKEEK